MTTGFGGHGGPPARRARRPVLLDELFTHGPWDDFEDDDELVAAEDVPPRFFAEVFYDIHDVAAAASPPEYSGDGRGWFE